MPPILWFYSLKSEKFKQIKLLKHQADSGQRQTPAISGVVASHGRGRRRGGCEPNFNCLSDGCRAPVRSVSVAWTQIYTARADTYHRSSAVTPGTRNKTLSLQTNIYLFAWCHPIQCNACLSLHSQISLQLSTTSAHFQIAGVEGCPV